jgi:F0F1-type ATP synthase assembly protein I
MSRASRRIKGDVATKTRDAYRSWSASSVGLEMGIAVIIGLLFGRWLDGKLGTDPWLMLVFTGFGMAAGLKGVFRAVREADKIAAENEAVERQAAEEQS